LIETPLRVAAEGLRSTQHDKMAITKKQWEELLQKAHEDDADAQWQVGSWYEDGLIDPSGLTIVRPNIRAAIRWYRKSAVAGFSCAQISLGNCLSSGRGTRRDDIEALQWYKCALRQGEQLAACNIATIYRDRGNNRRAFFWYKRAADYDDRDAFVDVGFRLYHGIGVKRAPKEAVRYYRKAIASKIITQITQAGREDAMYHLGVAYYEGLGVRKSIPLAIQWLSKANADDDYNEARELIKMIESER
jgi:TPR repeat protein